MMKQYYYQGYFELCIIEYLEINLNERSCNLSLRILNLIYKMVCLQLLLKNESIALKNNFKNEKNNNSKSIQLPRTIVYITLLALIINYNFSIFKFFTILWVK